jgi:hypothetical protein
VCRLWFLLHVNLLCKLRYNVVMRKYGAATTTTTISSSGSNKIFIEIMYL